MHRGNNLQYLLDNLSTVLKKCLMQNGKRKGTYGATAFNLDVCLIDEMKVHLLQEMHFSSEVNFHDFLIMITTEAQRNASAWQEHFENSFFDQHECFVAFTHFLPLIHEAYVSVEVDVFVQTTTVSI